MQEYTFRKSISYAFLAQGVLFLSSCITNLILPKYLGVVAYSYWQLFVFYANFIPLLALGLNDGIYLRYGGEKFETLNFSAITNQFILGRLYQIVLYMNQRLPLYHLQIKNEQIIPKDDLLVVPP